MEFYKLTKDLFVKDEFDGYRYIYNGYDIQIDYNDELVYNNMIFILKGIEMLKEPLKIYEYKSITDYKDNIIINSTPVTMEDFVNVISDMFIIGEDDAIEVPYKA